LSEWLADDLTYITEKHFVCSLAHADPIMRFKRRRKYGYYPVRFNATAIPLRELREELAHSAANEKTVVF